MDDDIDGKKEEEQHPFAGPVRQVNQLGKSPSSFAAPFTQNPRFLDELPTPIYPTSGKQPPQQWGPPQTTSNPIPPPPASPFLQYSTESVVEKVSSPHSIPPAVQYADLKNPTTTSETQKPLVVAEKEKIETQKPLVVPKTKNVDEMVSDFLLKSPKPLMHAKSLELEEWVELGHWEQVISLAHELLLDPSKGMERQLVIQSWLLVAFMKQKQYEKARSTLNSIGHLDDAQYHYESYPEMYLDKKGSFVPLRIRLIFALLPRYEENMTLAIDNLNFLYQRLQGQVKPILQDEDRTWRKKIEFILVGCYIKQKQFGVALRLFREMYSTTQHQEEKFMIGCQLGRLYLQMGNIKAAEIVYQKIHNEEKSTGRHRLNQGLLYFSKNEFIKAIEEYQAVLSLQEEKDVDGSLWLTAANNLAICALYCCDLPKAISCLEQLIQKNPKEYLVNATVFNLCTLYDLQCDTVQSGQKKQVLQKVAQLYQLHHISGEHFRI